jgi:hypothetical protein
MTASGEPTPGIVPSQAHSVSNMVEGNTTKAMAYQEGQPAIVIVIKDIIIIL